MWVNEHSPQRVSIRHSTLYILAHPLFPIFHISISTVIFQPHVIHILCMWLFRTLEVVCHSNSVSEKDASWIKRNKQLRRTAPGPECYVQEMSLHCMLCYVCFYPELWHVSPVSTCENHSSHGYNYIKWEYDLTILQMHSIKWHSIQCHGSFGTFYLMHQCFFHFDWPRAGPAVQEAAANFVSGRVWA